MMMNGRLPIRTLSMSWQGLFASICCQICSCPLDEDFSLKNWSSRGYCLCLPGRGEEASSGYDQVNGFYARSLSCPAKPCQSVRGQPYKGWGLLRVGYPDQLRVVATKLLTVPPALSLVFCRVLYEVWVHNPMLS